MAFKTVLILCTGNSCRSQIAEAVWNHAAGNQWRAFSAGSKPVGFVHPLAMEVLAELGIPTESLTSKAIEHVAHQTFDLVVTVCDGAAESCPATLRALRTIHWPTDDPAWAGGARREQLVMFRRVRDELRWRIRTFLAAHGDNASGADCHAMDEATCQAAERLIDAALDEDLGPQRLDATSAAVVPADAMATAAMVARSGGILCGVEVCRRVAARFGEIEWQAFARDGDQLAPMETIGIMRGNARQMLTAERTCLNFVGRLSGVATLTKRYVDLISGTAARIYDTRKTLPGWRMLDKYAVRCGGGCNHRMGLYDALLIKDNHLTWWRREHDEVQSYVPRVLETARRWISHHVADLPMGQRTPMHIEVDRLDQLDTALAYQPDMILLDNFDLAALREAVARRNSMGAATMLEASGGVTLETVAAIAATGVDRISIGALTHSAPALDVALDWEPPLVTR